MKRYYAMNGIREMAKRTKQQADDRERAAMARRVRDAEQAESEIAAQTAVLTANDLNIAAKIQLKKLAGQCREISRNYGKRSRQATAGWIHFWVIQRDWELMGCLGQTKLTPAEMKRLAIRRIQRFSSFSLAMKSAEALAKRSWVDGDKEFFRPVRIYQHPKHFEFWVFGSGRPKNEAGYICTLKWIDSTKRMLVDMPQDEQTVNEQLVGAQRIPFTITFCTDPYNADTYGEMVIRAFTEEGARTIFFEQTCDIPGMRIIDTASSDECQDDTQGALDEYSYSDRGLVAGRDANGRLLPQTHGGYYADEAFESAQGEISEEAYREAFA